MLIVIPDLHGRADLFEAAVRYYPNDTQFVFLGDAIDRGPDSKGCVRQLLDLSDAGRVVLLRGNHESMLSAAAEYDRLAQEVGDANMLKMAREEFVNWQRNGGNALFREYGFFGPGNVPEDLLEFIRRTRLAFESPNHYLCSHAAPPVLLDRYHTVADSMLWARPNEGPFNLEKHLLGSIHGHTPLAVPTWVERHLYIDLGAVFSGNLCTVNLESLETIVLRGVGGSGREALLELASDEDGLVREQPFKIVEV
jgi:serine/threonine protein phosphatase 1